jgi:hypothetical protein
MYDKNLIFSDAQSIAAAAGNVLSTSSYDTWQGGTAGASTPPIGGPLLNDIGRDPTPLFCTITEAVTAGGGAATIDFQLVQADDAALTSNLAVVNSTGGLSKAVLVVGYQPAVPPVIPAGRVTQRYIGMRYVIATNTTDTGKASSGINWDRETNTGGI